MLLIRGANESSSQHRISPEQQHKLRICRIQTETLNLPMPRHSCTNWSSFYRLLAPEIVHQKRKKERHLLKRYPIKGEASSSRTDIEFRLRKENNVVRKSANKISHCSVFLFAFSEDNNMWFHVLPKPKAVAVWLFDRKCFFPCKKKKRTQNSIYARTRWTWNLNFHFPPFFCIFLFVQRRLPVSGTFNFVCLAGFITVSENY